MIANTYNYLAAYGASAAYSANTTSGSMSVKGSYLEITGGTGGSIYDIEDGVDVSDQAREMLDRIRNLDVFSVIFPNQDASKKTKSLGEVKNDFMADFNDFASYFGSMSSAMGLAGSFTMGLNGTGGMTVEGSDQASADKLAASFSGNQTLTARFAVMAARAALTDAGTTVPGFKESYAQDPVNAIENNIDALKERLLGFRTVAGNGSMQYGFVRDVDLEIDYSSTTASYAATAAAEA